MLLKKTCFLTLFFVFALTNSIYAQTWVQINTDGFGTSNNEGARSMAVYNNQLYVGSETEVQDIRVRYGVIMVQRGVR